MPKAFLRSKSALVKHYQTAKNRNKTLIIRTKLSFQLKKSVK